jgi:hypothetical protein
MSNEILCTCTLFCLLCMAVAVFVGACIHMARCFSLSQVLEVPNESPNGSPNESLSGSPKRESQRKSQRESQQKSQTRVVLLQDASLPLLVHQPQAARHLQSGVRRRHLQSSRYASVLNAVALHFCFIPRHAALICALM